MVGLFFVVFFWGEGGVVMVFAPSLRTGLPG